MANKTAQILKYSLSFALAGVLVYFAFRGVDWAAFREGLASTRWFYMALYFAASLLALLFRAQRWKLMLKPMGVDVRLIDAWDADNIGNLTNIVIPWSCDFVRSGCLRSSGLTYDKTLGSAACERAWDFICIIAMFMITVAAEYGRFGGFFIDNIWTPLAANPSLPWILAAAAVALAAVLRLLLRKRPGSPPGKLRQAAEGLRTGFMSFARVERKWAFIALTLGIWTMYWMMSLFTLMAIPQLSHLGAADALFISALGNIATVIPVPGGIGAYHYLVALACQTLFLTSWDDGILFATLGHESHAVLVIIVGIISCIRFSTHRKRYAGIKRDKGKTFRQV